MAELPEPPAGSVVAAGRTVFLREEDDEHGAAWRKIGHLTTYGWADVLEAGAVRVIRHGLADLRDEAVAAPTVAVSVGTVRDVAAAMVRWCDDPTASPTVLGSILVPLVPTVRAVAVAGHGQGPVATPTRCESQHPRYGRCQFLPGHTVDHVTDQGADGDDDPGYSWPVATPTEPAPGSDEAYRLQQHLQAENRLVATLHGRSDPCTCPDCEASRHG